MMVVRTLRALRIGVLGIVVLAPLVSWMLTGPVGPYEGRPQTRYPEVSTIFAPDMAGRTRFADAVMERSWIRRAALTVRNTLDYDVFGGVEMERIVSGADRWLFYTPQFEAWNCERTESNTDGLEGLYFQAQLAAAGEVPIVFAIAPNKATIERDRVAGRAARYIDACYDETEARLRDLAANDETGLIVDHAAEVRRVRSAGADQYYATDSHWNSQTAVAAFNQLLSQPPVALGVPQWEYRTTPNEISPGMGHRMLQLNVSEREDLVVPEAVNWTALAAEAYPETVLVFRDSFYDMLRPMMEARMRRVIDIDINRMPEEDMADLVAAADAVVVERVERNLLRNYARVGRTAGNEAIYGWLLARNAETARQCAWQEGQALVDPAAAGDVEFRRMSRGADGGFHPDEPNARALAAVPAAWGDAAICVRIRVEAYADETAQLFVPAPQFVDAAYARTRSVVWPLQAGENVLLVALPGTIAGDVLRFHPVRSQRDFSIVEFSIAPRYAHADKDEAGAEAGPPDG